MADVTKRLCMYGGGRRPGLATLPVARLLVEEGCPHPDVQDPPGSAAKTETCSTCLIAIADRRERIEHGTWGPIRTLAETLRR